MSDTPNTPNGTANPAPELAQVHGSDYWLKSEPDAPGWWWWRSKPSGLVRIYNVLTGKSSDGRITWHVRTDGGDATMEFMRKRYPQQEWAGPVNEPLEPNCLERHVRAQYGDPVMDGEYCEECCANPVPVWAGINPDGDWTQLCAECVAKHNDMPFLRSNTERSDR